jgi:hypothetical protein
MNLINYLPLKRRMVSRDELKEEPKTNLFSHNTARETEENYE